MSYNYPIEMYQQATYSWQESFEDYKPSSNYNCKFVIKYNQNVYSFTATPDLTNDVFQFNLTATNTETITPGNYKAYYNIYKGDYSENYVVPLDEVIVFPSVTSNTDNRTIEEKILDAINELLQGRAQEDYSGYSFNGRSITKLSYDELIKARSYFQYMVNMQKGKAPRIIKVKFR